MKFEFLQPAFQEFKDAIDWYHSQSIKATEGFREKVLQAIESAFTSPLSAGFLVGKRTRKILLKPYSYGLIYFMHGGCVYVVAIAHNRRRPNYWRRRIKRA